MQNNKTLKRLLTISAVAAMCSAVSAQAQNTQAASAGQNVNQTGTSSQGKQNTSGKSMTDGTVDNPNSSGIENRPQTDSTGMSMGQSGASGTNASSSEKLSSGDEKALKNMAQANINEIAAGKIAVSKAQNGDVKAYAQQMIDDHGQALTKVQAVAQKKGVMLPSEPDAAHKAMAAKLEKLSGDAFDKAYMQNGGVKDHSAVHKKLMADAKKIKDADVKTVAEQHMPVVEQHLKSAQQMTNSKPSSASGK